MTRAWDRFFFEPRTARVLGLYRIVFGLIVLYSFALLGKDAAVYFSDAGVLSAAANDEVLQRRGLTALRWLSSPWGVRLTLGALFAAGILFTVGLHTRLSAWTLYLLVVSFHERNIVVLNGSDTVIRTMLFLFLFAPAGAAFSIDSLRRRLRGEGEEVLVHPWAQRMMQLQVALIYLVAGFGKLIGSHYQDGTAMYYILGRLGYHSFGVEHLMNYPFVYKALTWSMIAIEIPLPFLLWFPLTRRWGALAGILLHGWIIVFMVIPVFGIAMIAAYLPFFAERELDAAIGWARRRCEGRRARLYLDPGAVRLRKLVEAFDLFRRVEVADGAGEPRLVLATGKERAGPAALRWLALRCPATFWLAPVLCLPGAAALFGPVSAGEAAPGATR